MLKYRLGSAGFRHPVRLEDAARTVRTVRSRAGAWHFDPHNASAASIRPPGGHLAATLLAHFDAGQPDSLDPVERQSNFPGEASSRARWIPPGTSRLHPLAVGFACEMLSAR